MYRKDTRQEHIGPVRDTERKTIMLGHGEQDEGGMRYGQSGKADYMGYCRLQKKTNVCILLTDLEPFKQGSDMIEYDFTMKKMDLNVDRRVLGKKLIERQ